MSDPKSLDVIKASIRALEAELAADARFRELNILREAEEKLAALVNGSGAVPKRIGDGIVRTRAIRKGKQPKGQVSQHEAAKRVIEAAGHPLSSPEIMIRMPSFGAEVGGANKVGNLTSVLSKRGDLESIRWHGDLVWWIKGKEIPQ